MARHRSLMKLKPGIWLALLYKDRVVIDGVNYKVDVELQRQLSRQNYTNVEIAIERIGTMVMRHRELSILLQQLNHIAMVDYNIYLNYCKGEVSQYMIEDICQIVRDRLQEKRRIRRMRKELEFTVKRLNKYLGQCR